MENNGPLFNDRIKNDTRTYRESVRESGGGKVVEVTSSRPPSPAQRDSGEAEKEPDAIKRGS